MNELIIVKKIELIAIIQLNRPEKCNALNISLLKELTSQISELNNDTSIRCLIISGNGNNFCSGLDLKEASEKKNSKLSGELITETFSLINNSPHVTIAAIQGAALAGGVGILAACDFAIASDNSSFKFPEVHKGLVPALVMVLLLRKIQSSNVRELLLLGESITPQKAFSIGLITEICPSNESINAAITFAKRVLNGKPEAIKRTKQLFEKLQPLSFETAIRIALNEHEFARNSKEAQNEIATWLKNK